MNNSKHTARTTAWRWRRRSVATLTLPLVSADSTGEELSNFGRVRQSSAERSIIEHLKKNGPSRRADLEPVAGLGTSRVNDLLRKMVAEGTVVAEGATNTRRYRLVE